MGVREGAAASSRSRGAAYSVWSTWTRRDVTAYAGVDEITIVTSGDSRVVSYSRQPLVGAPSTTGAASASSPTSPQALRQVGDDLVAELFAAAWWPLVDQHGPKQARLFAQVLRAFEDRGEHGKRPERGHVRQESGHAGPTS